MTATNLKYFIQNLRRKVQAEQHNGKEVFFTLSVINAGNSHKVVDKIPPANIKAEIDLLIKSQKPELIKVDILDSLGRYIDGLVCDLKPAIVPETPAQPAFQGFGEAEVNAMVDKRFEEKKRVLEFEELKDLVKELEEENEGLHKKVEDLEQEKDELEEELEVKSQGKYYAGLLGDILESFGLSKDKIAKPIASLMGFKEEKEQKKIAEQSEDNSGIVEESAPGSGYSTEERNKREEIIGLIAEYLKTVNSPLLGQIFTIFSDIEADNSCALEIINFLNERKEATNA